MGPVRLRMVPRWWWYRLDARYLVRPHQQHGTRRVVDDEASGVTQAVRTETRTITIAGHNQEVDALGDRADDFALNPSPKMKKLSVRPSKPHCRGLQDRRGLLVRDILEMASRPVHPKAPAEQSGSCSFGDLADVGGRDVEQRNLRVGGNDLSGGVEAALPRALDQPHNDPHSLNHPINLSDAHKATVDASSTGGTVTTPRRRNSEVGSSSPRCRSTRRQSRVASEPT